MSRRNEILELKNHLEELKKEMRSAGNYVHYEQVQETYDSFKKQYLRMANLERLRRNSYSSIHIHKYPRRSIHEK
jgi:hypothetical protein